MRLRTLGIGMFALATLAGCGSGTDPYGGGGGGGGGGGPAGSVTVGNDGRVVFISAHNGRRTRRLTRWRWAAP